MKKKRFWKKVLIILLSIIVIIAAVSGLSEFIYNNYLNEDDVTLLETYKTQKEKCELLKSIPNDFIEEGKGINLQEIPNNIIYKINSKSDGNIQFYYYIEQESNFDSNPYEASITLSQDYQIIEESYGIELEDFETYKNNQKKINMFLSVLFAIMAICLTAIAAYGFVGIGWLIHILVKALKNKKSQS